MEVRNLLVRHDALPERHIQQQPVELRPGGRKLTGRGEYRALNAFERIDDKPQKRSLAMSNVLAFREQGCIAVRCKDERVHQKNGATTRPLAGLPPWRITSGQIRPGTMQAAQYPAHRLCTARRRTRLQRSLPCAVCPRMLPRRRYRTPQAG